MFDLASYKEARKKVFRAQYKSELSGVQELIDFRKLRACKNTDSPFLSTLEVEKFQIGPPPLVHIPVRNTTKLFFFDSFKKICQIINKSSVLSLILLKYCQILVRLIMM